MLRHGEFFREGEAEISAINTRVETLMQSAEYTAAREALHSAKSAQRRNSAL
jgi:hypothetical protein